MQLNKVTLISAGLILLFLGGMLLFHPGGSIKKAPISPQLNKNQIMELITQNDTASGDTPKIEIERNPFIVTASHGGEKTVVLSGVFLGSNKPSAIINNALVGVGDRIGDGYTVQEINNEHVVIIDAKKRKITLSMKEDVSFATMNPSNQPEEPSPAVTENGPNK